jgi:hypothetical protein
MIQRAALHAFLLLSSLCSIAQIEVIQGYFAPPLDIPLNLSGSFGELRTNHFHAGLDLKTQQREGLNVLSVADGFVSRIKVSPFGYGYALYVDHPNGYTSVYGHLQKYAPMIDAYIRREQYKVQSFSIDMFPKPGDLPVTKGQLLGLSGNSGGSGGPHLHFEIRETQSEKVMNPMLFGFDIKDKIPPAINSVLIVPMNDSAWVNGAQVPIGLETKIATGKAALKSAVPANVYGDIAFAVHTSDGLDGNANRCGIYRIELYVDGLQVYGQRMDRLDFTTNRAMNAHTLYERFKKNRSQIHGSYRLPGNPLDIYDNLVNDGIISFRDGKLHTLEYRVYDQKGNSSSVNFKVQSQTKGGKLPVKKNALARWDWEKDNAYTTAEVDVLMPAYTLYEDLDFTISKTSTIKGSVVGTYLIASPYEPVHNAYRLGIAASKVPERWKDKAIVVRWDPDKSKLNAEGGTWENGYLYARPMYLGYFGVMIDTIAPSIAPIDFTAAMKGKSSFSFRISDGLSGVDQIIPKIDGQWVLMEYDAKSSRLTCYFDPERMTRGKHRFELTILDERKNSKSYASDFEW